MQDHPGVRDDGTMTARIGRRGVLVGILGSLLAACGMGGSSDVDAVAAALRDATGDPRTTPYLDRRLDCGAVTVLDPIPADLPPLTRLTSQWQV